MNFQSFGKNGNNYDLTKAVYDFLGDRKDGSTYASFIKASANHSWVFCCVFNKFYFCTTPSYTTNQLLVLNIF